MSAVAEVAEPLVTAPRAEKLYMACQEELVLIKRRDIPQHDASGQRIEDKLGQRVQFRDGVLRVPLEHEQFKGMRGVEIPTDELVTWLDNHPKCGDHQEGFWLVPAPTPVPSEAELDNVVMLAEEGNLDGLDELIEQETAGWAREDLLRVAQGARERVAARLAADSGQ